MTTIEDVLRHLQAGSDAFTIMKELKLAPSKLQRMLRSVTMRSYLSIQSQVASAQMRMRLSQQAIDLPSRLMEIAKNEDAEIGRRACVNLLRQLAALDSSFCPPQHARATL